MRVRANAAEAHLKVLNRHMTSALVVPESIAIEAIDFHSLHSMALHPLLLFA